ncbi:flavin reductase family protein [Amycolatopsis pigmentata]|uniref:Flavin reductase family protein n=1 Tax=Amycolatopsis pigmentata TaxID=450801 RepID=A0ABW5FIS4_9PSEU
MFIRSTPLAGEPKNGGLPWDPFKALVAPRPIGWITSVASDGSINLAPFSFFNVVGDSPNMVSLAIGERVDGRQKDSRRNIEETGEFVCNLATWDLREQMNMTSSSVEEGVDEAELAGLALVPSQIVSPPRVARSPAALECVYTETFVPHAANGSAHHFRLILGEVVGVYIDDRFIADGRVDTAAMKPMTRMGYDEYAVVESAVRMDRPDLDIMKALRTPE